MTLDDIKDAIENSNNIVIFTHEKPDGDAIGSSLAFYMAMKNIGKNVEVVIPHYAESYRFLPGSNEAKVEPSLNKYDLAIALDCGDIKRLDEVDGIGEIRARTIKQSLKRMQEQFVFDNLMV